MRARSFAGRRFHAGSARSAAASARRVSAAPMRGTSAIVSPVAGLITGNVSPESASTHLPSTKAWRRSRAGSTTVTDRTIIERMAAQFSRLDAVRAFELAAGVSGQPLFGEGRDAEPDPLRAGGEGPAAQPSARAARDRARGDAGARRRRRGARARPARGVRPPRRRRALRVLRPEGALVLDVFCPVREDYRERWESEVQARPAGECPASVKDGRLIRRRRARRRAPRSPPRTSSRSRRSGAR